MRRKIGETPNSNRAYYFGLISLVLFFVQGILKYTKTVSDRNAEGSTLPDFLLWITLILLLFKAFLCILNGVRSSREKRTFKGVMGWIFGVSALVFLISVAFSL